MADSAPNPELLHSLGRLVRGLSALFWGLPVALVVCIGAAKVGWFGLYNIAPPLATTALLYFGLSQLDSFQKQERPWRVALDRAKILALINFGLSPYVFWWNQRPDLLFFDICLGLLALSAWLFVFQLNTVLVRLGAMLPDQTLRDETRQFTAMNQMLLVALLFVTLLQFVVARIAYAPKQWGLILEWWDKASLILAGLLGLLPLAMTMALLWKTKEVILDSVFGVKR